MVATAMFGEPWKGVGKGMLSIIEN